MLILAVASGDEGAKAIAAGLPQLTSLNLWDNQVGDEGAKAIAAGLPQLTSLNLSNNQVGDEGAKAIAAGLPQLTSLNLTANQVGAEGAKTIAAGLPQLTSLNLTANQVGAEGAKAIAAGLPQLTSLNLWDNQVGDEGAKAIAAGLPQLTSLNLWGNQVGDEGAKAIAAGLPQLTSLNLWGNQMGDEGAKAILESYLSGRRLRSLDLRNNRLTSGFLPPELLETTNAAALLAAYRRYAATPDVELVPLNEAKLVVVGNEAVGKTSLVRYLTTGQARDSSEPKTPGTAIHERIETRAWRNTDSPVQLNVWDFGGQEIMHGTHRYFLSERSLYLLVIEARREDDDSVFDWLKTIRNRGGDSPVIVVINKCDDGTHNVRLDQTALRRDYPNVIEVVTTSCEPSDFARQTIARLRRLIADAVADSPRLAHARNPIPGPWLRVKDAVTELAHQQSLLESATFVELCNDGDADHAIVDPNEQGALLLLLHDLGVVVAHGLGRDAPAALREVTLLDPNWLTGAVYALLTSRDVLAQGGEFSRDDLRRWLDPQRYPPQRYEFILDMMQNPDLGLCFRLPTRPDQERYLIPEALPANEPDYDTWPVDCLRFRYEYDLLPAGMVPRFIVQAHRHLTLKPTRWRSGVVLEIENCPVLVRGDRERRRVDIAVTGPSNLRRSALAVVRDDLGSVHAMNPQAAPRALVPLPDDPDNSVDYEHLLKLEAIEGRDYAFLPVGADHKYIVCELLDGVRSEQTPFRAAPPRSTPTPEDRSNSDDAAVTTDGPSWSPAQATRLMPLMVGAIIVLALVFLLLDIVAGAATAAEISVAALVAVLVVAAVVLRVSGRISEGMFSDLIKHLVRPPNGQS